MRRVFLFGPLAACLLPLFGGCAKSPAGGPVTRAVNRIQATLNIAGTVNTRYNYGVAFNDADIAGQGPEAILSGTPITNRIVGGSFRLLVLYSGDTQGFRVFYRSTPSDPATEREISGASGLFVTTPRLTQNGLNFILDLDAFLPGTSTFIFPHTTGTNPVIVAPNFNINAITTNRSIFRVPDDSTVDPIKPVDALGPQQVATPVQVQIDASRTLTLSDPTADINFNADLSYTSPSSPDYVPFANIDITSLQLGITRSSQG